MLHGVLSNTARVSNLLVSECGQSSLEQLSADWRCVKRNGKETSFDVGKIRHAVDRCFQKVGMLDADRPAMVEKIARGVVAAITQRELEKIAVEEVQRFVIAQLWTEGLFDAAEHYQNYREAHRKLRLTKPISADVQARFDQMQSHFPSDLQIYQLMSKFARWREAEQRRETWHELVYDRVMPWFKKTVRSKGHDLLPQEWDMLGKAMYDLQASPAMRVVQMAGPALDRCSMGVYNCAYAPIQDLFSFSEMLYILMQGTGYGFSVESDYVSELPRIKKQRGTKPETIVVEDTTEGWCNAYFEGLQRWWDGYDVWFNTDKVRKQGARLKTKGGRSSGPGPFLELMAFARNMIMAKQGRFLEDTDAHRLACFTGRIVQVGGVRRAATISLSDLSSVGMRSIKSGNWYEDTTYWTDGKYLTMANNSSVYDFPDQPPPVEVFMEEWLALVKSKSGERGIFNRQAALRHSPARRQWGDHKPGCNPCVTADTWVHTNNGPRLVKDLINTVFEPMVDGKPYLSDGFVQTGVMPVKKVRLCNGMEFRATDNHPVLVVSHQTQKAQRTEWVNVEDLHVGQSVVLHDHRGAWWRGRSGLEEGWLIGNLLGDGNIQADRHANLDYWGPDCRAMQEIAVTRIHQTVGGRADLRGCEVSEFKVRVQSRRLGALAAGYGLDCHAKYITPAIEATSAAFHVGFLRGYFDADGSVRGSTAKDISVQLTSVSLDDLRAVQRMLARLGIISSIYPNRHPAGPQVMPDGNGGSAVYECQARHELVVANDNIGVYAEVVGFDNPTKRTQLLTVLERYKRTPNCERFCSAIVEIVDDGVEPVYDCSVPGPEAFDANGCYLHNCAEILLRPHGVCNLSIAVARPDDTEETLTNKVIVATYFGVMQSLCTDFRYIRYEWVKNCEEERLLGVDITGHADCPLLRYGAPGRDALQRRLNAKVAEIAQGLSKRFNINYSAANTTVKPSGDSAVFFDCASGISPRFARQQIRWVRESKDSPVARFFIDSGVPYAPAPESPDRLWVFGFPKQAPDGCTLRNDMTAEQQFLNWLEWKKNWAEHSVSATIYVEEHEWPRLGALVYEHIDYITGLSFLPKDNGVYTYAPNEELTSEQYEDFVKKFPKLNWAKLTHYEEEDLTTGAQTLACTNGGCSLV